MILVKLYTEDEYRKSVKDMERFLLGFGDLSQPDKEPEEPEVLDWQFVFSSAYSGSGEPPFRDSISVDFLEQFGVTFVEGDWYSVMYKGVQMPLSHLEDGIKIALSAMTCSRQGKYMWFSLLGYDLLRKLADLPTDILFAVCRSESEAFDCITFLDSGCKFVNFPYQDGTIEVVCKSFHTFDKDACKGVLCGDDGRLYVYEGDDGVYYCDKDVSYVLQYRWWEDTENVVKYIDSCKKARVYLAKPRQTYSLFELGEILDRDENAIAKTEYLHRTQELEHDFQVGRITKGEYESTLKKLQGRSMYDEYLYLKDNFKVVCYMTFIPEEPEENLIIISVNKYPDGTYNLTGDKTYFKSKVCDAISSMFFKGCGDYTERVSLVFRQEQDRLRRSYIGSAKNMVERTVFGFKAMKDCVEVYDAYEAVQVFGAALKEAQDSGKCTGYTWIVRVLQI